MKTVNYCNQEWNLTALAATHQIARRTLEHRIKRFGATATGVQRALCTGIKDHAARGRIGKPNNPWVRREI